VPAAAVPIALVACDAEHSRCAREAFVEILWENIEDGKEHDFRMADCEASGYDWAEDFDPYDESSIMHYGTHAFSTNDQPTIRSLRDLDHLMGNRAASVRRSHGRTGARTIPRSRT